MMFLKSRGHAEQPPQEDDNGNPKDDVSVSSSVMKLALPENIDDLANFGFSAVDASDGESLGTAVDPAFIDATDVASIDEPAAGSLSSREWLVVSPTKSCFSAYRPAAKAVASVRNRWDVNNISAGYRPSAPPLPKLGGLPNPVFRRAPQNRISHQEGHPYRVPPPRSRLFTPGFAALHRTGFDVGQADVSTIHVCQVDDSIPSTSLGLQQLTTRISYSHCQSMEQAYDKAKATQIEKWCRVVRSAGNHSSLFVDASQSKVRDAHIKHVAEPFAPSTLEKYLHIWDVWVEHCSALQIDPFLPVSAVAADFLHAHSKGSLGSAVHWWKGLSWVCRHAGLAHLLDCIQAPMVKAYTKTIHTVVRRESTPFLLSFVVAMERSIIAREVSPADILQRGALLVCIWASLRWADAQWVRPSCLQLHHKSLLGFSARTKTTRRPMPFGVFTEGFLGRDGSSSWVSVWYPILVQALADTKHQFPNRKPDFLVTEVGPDACRPVFMAPMSRNRGVIWLRALVRAHLEAVGREVSFNDMSLVGVHSAKTTMLSWARQLGLSEESRRLQGHHRGSAAGQSIQLYARDDVFPALELQKTVAKQFAMGFRPICPVLRGSAPPIIDAAVHIPPWGSEANDNASEPLTPATVIDAIADNSDVDTSSSSAEDMDEDDSRVEPAATVDEKQDTSINHWLFNPGSLVIHIATACSEEDPLCTCVDDTLGNFKTACGVRPVTSDQALQLLPVIPAKARLCLRFGCRKSHSLENQA